MDNLGILIQAILSLKDTTDSKNQIAKELPKLESQLQSDKNTRVKIVAGLDIAKSKNLIQSQLNTLTNQAKAPTIKVGIDTSGLNSVQGATQNITNSLKNVQTQAQQASKSIEKTLTTISADNISDKMVKEFQNSFGIIGKKASETKAIFKDLFATLNNAWYAGDLEKYNSTLTKIYDTTIDNVNASKQLSKEAKNVVDFYKNQLTDGSKVFIDPNVRTELEYILGTSEKIKSVLSTVFGVGKWSYQSGISVDSLSNLIHYDDEIRSSADSIVDAYNKIQQAKSQNFSSLYDTKYGTDAIKQQTQSLLNLKDVYVDLNGVEHNFVEGLGWFEEIVTENEKIATSLNTVQKEARETSIALGEIGHNFISNNQVQATFGSIKQAEEYFKGLNLGDVSVGLNKGSLQGLTDFTIKVKSATGEIERFRYAVNNVGDDQNPILEYNLTNINASNEAVQRLRKNIEETKTHYSRLLSDFKSSNSAIQSGLTQPIQQFETVLNGLGKTSSINDVKNAFESLKQSASEITKYLDTTNSSFNKATNAVNNYKNMDNILKDMTASFNNLVMKPENLRTELDGVKSKLVELQNLEKTEGGYTKAWAEKYREVNLELAQVKTNIELALKAEGSSQKADKNSAYQTQLKYLNKIKEETNTIISLKRKMVNAGDEEKAVYQHEITNAQKRIQYDVQQLDKKKLLTDEAKRLVNTYKEQIALQDKINSAKTSDKNVQAQSQQLKDYITQVSKAIVQLNSLQNSPTFTKNASNPQVTRTKQDINSLITAYQNLATKLQGNITPSGLETVRTELTQLNARFNTATATAKQFETELKNDNGAEKLAQRVELLKAQLTALAKANPKALKQFGNEINSLMATLNNNPDGRAVEQVAKSVQLLRKEINNADLAGKNLWQTIGDQIKKFSSWMTLTGIISGLWRDLKQMVTNVIELDSAMTNLKKVTDETDATYSRFLKNASQQAKELKMDLSDLVNQTAEWAKKGYSIAESSIASKASGIYSVVGEVDNATAVQDLTTVIKSYNMAVEDSIDIVDRFNNISNKYSVTASDIGTMLSNSISSLSIAGNSLDEAIAMGTTITEITGDASEAGNTLKVLSMRLRGASTEIENAGESTDGMAESTSKLREKILALTNVTGNGGFDIMADADNFKSTYEIMKGISEVWNDISDVNQAKDCLCVQKCA